MEAATASVNPGFALSGLIAGVHECALLHRAHLQCQNEILPHIQPWTIPDNVGRYLNYRCVAGIICQRQDVKEVCMEGSPCKAACYGHGRQCCDEFWSCSCRRNVMSVRPLPDLLLSLWAVSLQQL